MARRCSPETNQLEMKQPQNPSTKVERFLFCWVLEGYHCGGSR
jgi:hypothetical protein